MPNWMLRTLFGTPVWKWFGLCLTLVLLIAVMWVIYRRGSGVAQAVRETSSIRYFFSLSFLVAAMLIPVMAKYIVADPLKLRGDLLNIVTITLNIIFLRTVIVAVLGISNHIAAIIIARPNIHPKGLAAQFIRVTCRLLGLVAAAVLFLEGGRQLGVPITTLLAGAGVGGLAFAMAAQDTLKTLFGSMMIFFDKPYRVGERIVTKDYGGVVEEIGLRSTRIRLLTGHQATIPNEDMARSDIENIGRRHYIRRCTNVALEHNTPPEKV